MGVCAGQWRGGGRVTRMAGDLATLAADAVPFVTLAVGTYGRAVFANAWDDVADASVKAGLRCST
jgi:hypothetical protein